MEMQPFHRITFGHRVTFQGKEQQTFVNRFTQHLEIILATSKLMNTN